MDGMHNKLTLTGLVVETLERDGKQVAKIAFKTCHVYVPMDAIPDTHLGDTVTIDADILVQKVGPDLDAAGDRHRIARGSSTD